MKRTRALKETSNQVLITPTLCIHEYDTPRPFLHWASPRLRELARPRTFRALPLRLDRTVDMTASGEFCR